MEMAWIWWDRAAESGILRLAGIRRRPILTTCVLEQLCQAMSSQCDILGRQ